MNESVWIPIDQMSYRKAKFTRPHIILKDGTLLKYCFLNAGIFRGYDESFNSRSVKTDEVAGIKYNEWGEWSKWQRDNWEKLYGEKR